MLKLFFVFLVLFSATKCVEQNGSDIRGKQQITWISESVVNLTVAVGKTATLSCKVEDLGNYRLAWINKDRLQLLTLHERVITRDKRITVRHENFNSWFLNIRNVTIEDSGQYMCQINTSPMISQKRYLEVVVPSPIEEESTISNQEDSDETEGRSEENKDINKETAKIGADPKCVQHAARPMDCGEILRSGASHGNGIYTIWPRSRMFHNKSLQVFCDMETDGGGWTVIQRRGNYSTPKDYFYKKWWEYQEGFGILTEEFWAGLDNIFAISNQAIYSIRFDMKHADGESGYALYDEFYISDENSAYQLDLEGGEYYSGNVGDAMWIYRVWKFSTKDRDNDDVSDTTSCAVERKGAWWYSSCAGANLNGLYQPGIDSKEGIYWYDWKENYVGLSWVEMKLRSK